MWVRKPLKVTSNRRIFSRCRNLKTSAFVLINVELGGEEDLLKKLHEIEGVTEAYMVYGVYDIVCKITGDDLEKVKEIITWKIRRLDKVRSTLTMIVVEEALKR